MSSTNVSQPSMADLLKHVSNVKGVQMGDQVTGTIIYIAKNEVLLDIENIGLAVVRGRELYNEEYLSRLAVGETVEAVVIDLDNERNMIECSFRAIGRDKIWAEISEAFTNQATIEAKVRDANRGGFLVKVHGVDGFLPASLLSPAHAIKNVGIEDKSLVNQMKKYVGQIFNVKIISANPEEDTVIVSERSVSDEIASAKLSKYKVGDVVEGAVVGAVDFGVFVRFDDDLEGLVHISEIAWKKVEDPRNEFTIGQKVKARIVDIDEDNRINLSIKQTLQNPWVEFAKSTKPGDTFTGKVVRIVTYGAIVVNDEDIQGLCHISQLSEKSIETPSQIHDILKVGQTRDFTILGVSVDEKLYLTLLPFEKAKEIEKEMGEKIRPKGDSSEEAAEEKAE